MPSPPAYASDAIMCLTLRVNEQRMALQRAKDHVALQTAKRVMQHEQLDQLVRDKAEEMRQVQVETDKLKLKGIKLAEEVTVCTSVSDAFFVETGQMDIASSSDISCLAKKLRLSENGLGAATMLEKRRQEKLKELQAISDAARDHARDAAIAAAAAAAAVRTVTPRQ